MIPGSRHIPTWSTRHRVQRLARLQSQFNNLQANIESLLIQQQSLRDKSKTPEYQLREVRLEQRCDLITNKADLEASKYYLASIEFELRYYAHLTLWDWVLGGRKVTYTEEMVADLWDVLVKALRFEEEVQALRDDVVKIGKDFSDDSFRELRGRMWLLSLKAKRLVGGVRNEVRRGERAVERKKK